MNKTIVGLLTVIFFGNVLFSTYAEAETFCTITATNASGGTVELKDLDCDGIPDKSCTDCSPPYLVDNCLNKPNGSLMGSCIGGTKAGESCTTGNECGESSLCSMGQEDSDADGIGDVCDYCDGAGQYDTDEDGICENDDNCPGINNPDQMDSDKDGNGDLCSNRIEKFAPVKSFTGSWYEIGRQVGRTFPDNIIEFGNLMGQVLLYVGPGNGWTPQTFYDATLEWIPESVQQHMQGMAMGITEVSPISYATAWDLVLTQNMAVELLNMAKNITPIPTPEVLACTSFGVTSPAGSFLAHNTDAQSTGKSTAAIMYWKPTNGDFAYLTMDPPGWADVAFGLNEKGIGVTMNAGNPNTAAAMGMYPNFLIRYSMEHASTLEEAVGLFEDHLDSGNTFGPTGVILHYMDFNQNTMAKIELRSEAIKVTYGQQSTSGATYIGSANHFVDGFSPDPEYYYESSDERYNRLMVLMELVQTFDLNASWSVLSDTNGGEPNNNTISRKGTFATSSTVFGTIFTPDGLYYAMGKPHAYLEEYGESQFLPLNFEDADSDGTVDAADPDTIYGTVTGDVQEGVKVNIYRFNCGGDIDAGSPVTNSEGDYNLGELENSRYWVLPEADGYSFVPGGRWVDIPNEPGRSYDFTATKITYCVSGETQICYCSDGTETEQTCKTDETGWEPCICTEYTIWNDPDTTLSWQDPQKDAYVLDYPGLTQPDALRYCEELVMGGYENWRLPNIDELRTLVRGNPSSETDGACPVHEGSLKEDMTDPACVQAPDYEGPGTGGCYWAPELTGPCDRKDPADEGDRALETVSSTLASNDNFWVGDVLFDQGSVVFNHIYSLAEARCVRDGPTEPNTCADGTPDDCDPGATRQCTAANGKTGAQDCADNGLCWLPCDSTSFVPSPPVEDVSEQCDQVQLTLTVPVQFESPPQMLLAFLYSAEKWAFPPARPPDGGTDYNQVLDPDIDLGKPLQMTVPACSYYRDRCIDAGEYYLYVGLLQSNEWPPWPAVPGDYSFGAVQIPLMLNDGPRQVIELEPLLDPYVE